MYKENNYPLELINTYREGIMGMAMLSIMLFHQEFSSIPPLNVFHHFGYWGVEIFLFLSGMGMVNSLKKNSIKVFYYRRAMRLIPSCLLIGSVKYCNFLFFSPALDELKEGLHIGYWSICSLDLWFIHSIIIYYSLSPFLYKLIRRCPIHTLIGIVFVFLLSECFISPYVGPDWASPLGVLSWTIGRLPVFVLGMLVAQFPSLFRRGNMIVSSICLVFAILITVTSKQMMLPRYITILCPLYVAVGTLMMVESCAFLLKRSYDGIQNFFGLTGKLSLELYLIHEYIIWSLYVLFALHYNNVLLLIVSLLISYLLALIASKLLSTLKLYKKR